MRFRLWLAAVALIGAFALPTIAAAQSIAYTVPGGRTYMRAGPGVDFPIVAQVLGGSVVDVYGCLSDFSWCDSSVQGIRGWIASIRLEFDYAGGLVPFPNYSQYFGAPIIGFSFGYWDDYYRDRSFYRNRHRHGYRDRDRGPVTREIPDGQDGFEPPRSGGRYRPYSDVPGDGYDQLQRGAGAGPARRNSPGPGRNGLPPTEYIPPRSGGGGGGGGAPCPPQNPACQ